MKLQEFRERLPAIIMNDMEERYINKLIDLAIAIQKERYDLDDCYCDVNSNCIPCTPCEKREAATNKALKALEQ